MTKKTAREALENTLLGIDASIRQLLVLQALVNDQLEALDSKVVEPEKDPLATMGTPEPLVENCTHEAVQERQTMGTTWYLCVDCKEMIPEDQVDL